MPASPATRLSAHFTLNEFTVSRQFPALVAPVPEEYVPNVERLVTTVLEPWRVQWGVMFTVNSGYRSPALNLALGGSPTSQHLRAEASDVTFVGLRRAFRDLLIRKQQGSCLPVGQVIFYPARMFIHVALPSAKYPEPAFFVHWPERKYEYRQVMSAGTFDRLLA